MSSCIGSHSFGEQPGASAGLRDDLWIGRTVSRPEDKWALSCTSVWRGQWTRRHRRESSARWECPIGQRQGRALSAPTPPLNLRERHTACLTREEGVVFADELLNHRRSGFRELSEEPSD